MSGRWPHGDPDAVIRSILSDPAYAVRAAPGAAREPSLWERFLQWAQDALRPLLEHLSGLLGGSSRVGSFLAYVLIGAAFAGLVVLFVRILRAYYARTPERSPRPRAVEIEEERTCDEWRAFAAECAQRGEYARAIRALFNAALAGLHERALVPFDPARAPGEYRRLVRGARAAVAPAFDSLAERFVYASYAPVATERADFEAAARAFSALEPELRRA